MSGTAPVSFEDLVPTCDPADARRFIDHMYGGREGYAIITRISSTGKHIVWSKALTVPQIQALFSDEDASNSMNGFVADDGGRWNVYVSCALHEKDPTDGGKRRGGKTTIEKVHEVRLDLDLKDESFKSPAEIDEFISTFPLPPTLIVDSGIGAKHCYWILDNAVPKDDGERLNRGWWAMAQEMAGSAYIDRVWTADRIMRLPGTVRWPKAEGERASAVKLVGGTGVKVPSEDLWKACEPSYLRAEAIRSEVNTRITQTGDQVKEWLASVEDITGWPEMYAVGYAEERFNARTSWDQILLPFGWKVWKDDYEGRRHWVRPGKTQGTSATTDYPPSPNIMTLFSNAADPRLVKLDEAGVTLTKFRVYAELKYDGDTAALTREMVNTLKGRASEND